MTSTPLGSTALVMCVVAALAASDGYGQSRLMKTYGLQGIADAPTPAPPSNSISHIAISNGTIWIGTSKGVARSRDGGNMWDAFGSSPEFKSPGIFAIAVKGDTVWTSTGFSKEVESQSVQTGSGYTFSTTSGTSWTSLPQTLDGIGDSIVTFGTNTVRFVPIVVNEQNVTFDIALSDSTVWIASWASGLRRTTNQGQTWERVVLPSKTMSSISPLDTLVNHKIDPRLDNNYLAFAVYAQTNSIVWAGTAGGINRSADGGLSWMKFTRDNQIEHILGDWVIAVRGQHLSTGTRIWITNWPAEGANQQYGVSFTDDDGRTWTNALIGIKAYDFAFKDSSVYIATDEGVYRSSDGGKLWERSGSIIDPTQRAQITSNHFFAVGVLGDTVFCGSDEGLVRTVDRPGESFGRTWEIIRAAGPAVQPGTAYAFPNPFSPKSEKVRIHYSTGGADANVSVEIFDFGMNRIRTLVRDAVRSGPGEQDEVWDGRNDSHQPVPNGVYFYRVSVTGKEPAWGKVMVLQ